MRTCYLLLPLTTMLLVATTTFHVCAQAPGPPPVQTVTIADTAPGWIWDRMLNCDAVDPSISSAHAGGPGSSGTYIFAGTGVTIFGVGARTLSVNSVIHRTGKLRVSLDGVPEGVFPEYAAGQAPGTPVLVLHNLVDANHSLLVEPVDGWAGISSLIVEHSAPAAAGNGASFFEDFSEGNTRNWAQYGGNWSLNGHWFIVDAGPGNKAIISGSQYTNFKYDADVAITGTGDGGLILRVSSPTVGTDAYNGYYVGLDTSHQQIVVGKAQGSWTQLASQPYVLKQNVSYQLRVIAEGSVISVYVQGQYILSVTDSTFTAGSIGVRAFNSGAGFTNIQTTKMGK